MACCLGLFAAGDGLAEEPEQDATKAIDPAVERAAFVLSDDVEVSLFAHEPMVENPLAMQFDDRGRLWVACAPSYPHVLPGKEPNDYVVILEDTDGDGRADKSTKFAEGLYVPTGFALGDGGAYVANQPEVLFFKDTDGDDRADVRKSLLTGFGTADNHHAISAWVWGPGGTLYFQQGIFLKSNIETPYGIVRINDHGGIFGFLPRKMKLDVYVAYGTNPWGHAFDAWGQDFMTEAPQGNIYDLLPSTVASRPSGRIAGGGFARAPKSCGVEFVYSQHFPEDWQGDLILNAFKQNQVLRYKFGPAGSGYSVKLVQPPLISSKLPHFRPVDVKTGADGAIYIADWYNPIIGHMQYNFRDERRDHTHGRIWRITHKGSDPLPKPDVAGASLPELCEMLKSPESNTRYQARRRMYELEASEVAAALQDYVKNLSTEDPNYDLDRLQALWCYQTIDVFEPELLRAVLRSREPQARAAAVRVLRGWREHMETDEMLRLLENAVTDANARVRLEAVVTLSYVRSPETFNVALLALDRDTDRNLEFALRNAIPTIASFGPAGGQPTGGDVQREVRILLFLVQHTKDRGKIPRLLELIDEQQVPAKFVAKVLPTIAEIGSPDQLATVFRHVVEDTSPNDVALKGRCLDALRRSAQQRNVQPAGDLSAIKALLGHADTNLRTSAMRLAGAWKIDAVRPELEQVARADGSSDVLRQAAVAALVDLGGDKTVVFLKQLGKPSDKVDGKDKVRSMAIVGLAEMNLDAAVQLAASAMSRKAVFDPTDAIGAILARKGGAEALAAALKGRELPADTAKLAVRKMFAVGRQDPVLVKILEPAAGLQGEIKPLSEKEMKRLVKEIQTKGDPHRGELVFRRADLSCTKCHAICGGGPHVGPDLQGLGKSSPIDYLADSVREPSKEIREAYETTKVLTLRGQIVEGIKEQAGGGHVVLRNAKGEHIRIRQDNIDEEIKSETSFMPDGLRKLMTDQEYLDLVKFLSELGRPGAFETPTIPVVRTWQQVVNLPAEVATADTAAFYEMLNGNAHLLWEPIYSRVAGALPMEELAKADGTGVSVVSCSIEVSMPGEILLKLNSAEGLTVWVDSQLVTASKDLVVDLPRGKHKVTFRIDHEQRGDLGLRVDVDEVKGSGGRALVAQGK